MNKKSPNELSFLSGFVQNRDTCRVIAQVDELRNQGSTSSWIMTWRGNEGGKWYSHTIEWVATRLSVVSLPELQICVIGPDGVALLVTSGGIKEEEIDNGVEGPSRRGHLRDIRFIGEHFYVAGMNRQVYRKEGPGQWLRQDDGVVQSLGSMNVAGFNAIDGKDESNIYAVGFAGEIWRRRGGVWQSVDSPTNLVLHRVHVVKDNLIYASGQSGVLLRGNGNRWELIDHNATTEDLWGLEWFQDSLYVACDDGLFVLGVDDSLTKVDMGLGEQWTCRHIHANDGVLWSFGPKHIAWTENGKIWHDVTP